MRRSAGVLLAIGLVGSSTVPSAAQAPSTSPTPAGQRTLVPEAGFALTLPEGWTLETQDVVEQTDSPEGPTEVVHTTRSYAFAPDGSASCLLMPDRLEGSLEETAAAQRPHYEPALVEMSPLELPHGRAIRFVLDYAGFGDVGVGAVYLISDDVGLIVMSCVAPEPPGDEWWLSLAQTLEFLPAGG